MLEPVEASRHCSDPLIESRVGWHRFAIALFGRVAAEVAWLHIRGAGFQGWDDWARLLVEPGAGGEGEKCIALADRASGPDVPALGPGGILLSPCQDWGSQRVRPLGFEPRTCGLRVRCSAIELEARGLDTTGRAVGLRRRATSWPSRRATGRPGRRVTEGT